MLNRYGHTSFLLLVCFAVILHFPVITNSIEVNYKTIRLFEYIYNSLASSQIVIGPEISLASNPDTIPMNISPIFGSDQFEKSLRFNTWHAFLSGDLERANEIASQLLVMSPKDEVAAWLYGTVQIALGNWDEAREQHAKISYYPLDHQRWGYSLPVALRDNRSLLSRLIALAGKDGPNKENTVRQAIRVYPEEASAYQTLLRLYVEEGNWKNAVLRYRQLLGLIGIKQSQVPEYLLSFVSNLRVNAPEDNQLHFIYASLLLSLDRPYESVREFQELVNDLEVSDPLWGQITSILLLAYLELGDLQKACEGYEEIRLNKELAPISTLAVAGILLNNGTNSCIQDLVLPEPQTITEVEYNHQLTLVGYTLSDKFIFDLGLPIWAVLFWQGDSHLESDSSLIKNNGLWIQVLKLENLAPNPSFEWDEAGPNRYPFGYSMGWAQRFPDEFEIRNSTNPSVPSQYLHLHNGGKVRSTNIEIADDQELLVLGSVRGYGDATAEMGIWWTTNSQPTAEDFESRMLLAGSNWKSLGFFTRVPRGLSTVRLHFGGSGQIDFDDLIMIPVSPLKYGLVP
jgi:tetratricopeptide (TPR) repeat protein